MKKLLSLLLTLVVTLSVAVPAFAAAAELPEPPAAGAMTAPQDPASPNAEETQWYFRENNGRKEMRLWSITYKKWLTDWIDCGPAD